MQQPTTSRTLNGVRGMVFDLDGTLLHGGTPLPGAVETLARLRRDRMPLVFCTQDTENTDPAIAARLSRMGFAADPDEIISCGSALTRYLADHYRDLPVRAIGNERQIKLLADHGVRLVESNEPARAVVIALYSGFSMHDVETACNAVWAGADLVAIALDRSFPTPDGLVPGTGALVRAVEHTIRRRARVLGKPSIDIALSAQRRLGQPANSILVVGDSIDVDIRLGKAAGFRTALVLSGCTVRRDLARIPSRRRPDIITADVAALFAGG